MGKCNEELVLIAGFWLWRVKSKEEGRAEQTNFGDYRVLRINEVPRIDVHLVKSPEAPGGIGEPGTSCVMPALTNAMFAATCKRIRKLPFADQARMSA